MVLLDRPAPKCGSSAGSKDFVYQNALATKVASVTAKERRHTADEEEGKKWIHRQDFGQVPSYLQARKLQLAQQHEEAQVRRLSERSIVLFVSSDLINTREASKACQQAVRPLFSCGGGC